MVLFVAMVVRLLWMSWVFVFEFEFELDALLVGRLIVECSDCL